jgi:hypothetical protein
MQKHIVQSIEYDRDKVLQLTISESFEMIVLLDNVTKGINPMNRDLTSSQRLGMASHSVTAMIAKETDGC